MAIDMKKCEVCGKFYNAATTPSCPFCADAAREPEVTQPPLSMQVKAEPEAASVVEQEAVPVVEQKVEPEAVPVVAPEEATKTGTAVVMSTTETATVNAPDTTETVLVNVPETAEIKEETTFTTMQNKVEISSVDPVVGWLVCIEGNRKGQEYRLHSDHNYIGSSTEMDLCIQGDKIAEKNHASVTFDSRKKKFFLTTGEGRGIIYVNDDAVLSSVELKANDKIEIADYTFLFIPLCGESFCWE